MEQSFTVNVKNQRLCTSLVCPKAIACRADLSFSPDVFFLTRSPRCVGRPAWNFAMVSTRPYFIMPVQNFGGCTPKKFGAKNM